MEEIRNAFTDSSNQCLSITYYVLNPELGAVILTEEKRLHRPFDFSLEIVVVGVSTYTEWLVEYISGTMYSKYLDIDTAYTWMMFCSEF